MRLDDLDRRRRSREAQPIPQIVPPVAGQRVRLRPRRRPYGRLYQSWYWRELRTRHLARAPLCSLCARQGLDVPADAVDHIIPHRGDVKLFRDPGNLQSLCNACHAAKTGAGL